MAKLIYSAIMSLDGFVADRDGNFDWAVPDDELHSFINDQQRPIGMYLYGRRMYDVMVGWETAPTDPSQSPVLRDFAQIWKRAHKIVFSKTLKTASSARTCIERDFDAETVRRMKAGATADLSVGGPQLAGQALNAGLVDEIQLFITPVMVGGGTSAFPSDLHVNLELLDVRRFPNGAIHLNYRTVGE